MVISAPLTLLNSQQWLNNSAGGLTISGAVATAAKTLTVAGTGSTLFNAPVTGNGLLIVVRRQFDFVGKFIEFRWANSIGNQSSGTLTPTVNFTGGTTTIAGRIGMGGASGSRSVLNISNAATVTATGDFIMFGGNSTGGNAGNEFNLLQGH